MGLLAEAGIKVPSSKRTLLVKATNFPLEILYLRDDDIPQSVATGVADIGIVGENEFAERGEDAEVVSRLGFSRCKSEEHTSALPISRSPRTSVTAGVV